MTTNRKTTADDERRGYERTAVDAVRRILQGLRVAAYQTRSTLGISGAQLYLLRHIAQQEGLSLTELARRTLTDRSSVTDVVERLVEQGLATRDASRTDRRRASVRVTPLGARIASMADPAPTDLLVMGLQRLEREQVRGLAENLIALVGAMGLEHTRATMLFEGPEAPQPPGRGEKG